MRPMTSIAALAIAAGLTAGAAHAQQQKGLVNVAVGDIAALNEIGILEGSTVQVPVGIAAQVCDVDANIIAQQGDEALTDCTVTQEQATTAFISYLKQDKGRVQAPDSADNGDTDQDGLVNVAIGDVDALNDIGIANGATVQVPVEIAAEVCGVDVNVIAEQGEDGATVCTVEQEQATQSLIDYVKLTRTG